jgi:hypothetical protein
MESRRDKYDGDVVFTKRGIVDYVERKLAETPNEERAWTLKIDKPNDIMVWMTE